LKLRTKDVALVCSFASLYAVLWFGPLFPVVGAQGRFFPLATVIAPLIGLILGPYIGTAAVSIGGFVGWTITQSGPLVFLSSVPGATATLCSGLLYKRKWMPSAVLYVVLFLTLAFYPAIGPGWLFPYFLWFHLVGLAVLVSPLRAKAVSFSHKQTSFLELSFGVGVISFVATLFGHIVGGLLFQMMYFPTIHSQVDYWRNLWQTLTILYPLERTLIALLATAIGVPLIKALRAYGFEIGGVKTHATLQNKNQAD